MTLIDSEPEKFKNALLDAYPSSSQLEQMLYYKLNRRLSDYVEGKNREETIFQLIVAAEAEDWTEQLVIAAHKYKPGNKLLESFYLTYSQKYGLPPEATIQENTSQETLQTPKPASVEGKGKPSKMKTTKRSHPTETYGSVSPGPDRFLAQANKYLQKAQQCTKKGASLFQAMDKNGFTSAQYKETLELPKQLHEHLDNLYELVEITSPFPDIVTSYHQQNISKRQLISKIELIAEHIENELVPSLDSEDLPYKEIEEKFEQLKQMVGEFYPLFQAGGLPVQVRLKKPGNSQVSKTGRHVRKNGRTMSSSNQFPREHITSPLTSDLRNQLIDALLILPVTGKFAGRSVLLNDIPGSLDREESNEQLDLEMIINQLDRLGQLSSGDSTKWPLLLLIDNALRYAKDYKQPEETLKMVWQVLAKAYEAM